MADDILSRQKSQLDAMREQLTHILEDYQQDPSLLAEALAFKDQFHTYSMNNAVLLKKQNPHATYVAGFNKWKELGYSVKKGQHGIKVLVPQRTKLFPVVDRDGRQKYKLVSQATADEAKAIALGEIRVMERTAFGVGTVFDISQTDCPVQDYPKLYNMGYASAEHADLYDAIKTYVEQTGATVGEADLSSISLRGTYDRVSDTITLSDKLNDTQKLDTLTHELGHAVMCKEEKQLKQEVPRAIAELEADAVSIMLQTHVGLGLTDARKSHFVQHYKVAEVLEGFRLQDVLKRVNAAYYKLRQGLDPYLDKVLETSASKSAEAAGENAGRELAAKRGEALVVNLYGGPGAGKTTCAWEVASELKKRGYNAEYVSEYSKELVYEGRMDLLDGSLESQRKIYAEQQHRIDRLLEQVDVIVTDSPLMLSPVYLKEPDAAFLSAVRADVEQYNNFNLIVQRGDSFQQSGRIHNEQQSKQLDGEIRAMLDANGMYYGIYDHSKIQLCVDNIEKTFHRIHAKEHAGEQEKGGHAQTMEQRAARKEEVSPRHKNYELLNELAPQVVAGQRDFIRLSMDPASPQFVLISIGEERYQFYQEVPDHGEIIVDPHITLELDRQNQTVACLEVDDVNAELERSALNALGEADYEVAAELDPYLSDLLADMKEAGYHKAMDLPKKVESSVRVTEYLTKTQGIDPMIVEAVIRDGTLYEDVRHNAVFIGRDELSNKAIAYKHTTIPSSGYKQQVENSEPDYGVTFGSLSGERLYVTQEPIDSLKRMTKGKAQGDYYDSHTYLATCDNAPDAVVFRYLEDHLEVKEVVLDHPSATLNAQLKEQIQANKPVLEVLDTLQNTGQGFQQSQTLSAKGPKQPGIEKQQNRRNDHDFEMEL